MVKTTVIATPSLKVTLEGIILTLKNIGIWLASYSVSGIQAEPSNFIFAFLIYALVSIPSDLYALNHITTHAKEQALKEAEKNGR